MKNGIEEAVEKGEIKFKVIILPMESGSAQAEQPTDQEEMPCPFLPKREGGDV